MWVIALRHNEAVLGRAQLPAVVSQLPKTQADSVITLPLSQPAMLNATASPFTAFPLQTHRSLHKVKKAGPVYFGRWNIFWKSNKSAIFSVLMAGGAGRTKAFVGEKKKKK